MRTRRQPDQGGVTRRPPFVPTSLNADRNADDQINGVGNRLVSDNRRSVSQSLQSGDMPKPQGFATGMGVHPGRKDLRQDQRQMNDHVSGAAHAMQVMREVTNGSQYSTDSARLTMSAIRSCMKTSRRGASAAQTRP